jgi:SAM-dependent methyltransferase
MQVFPMTMGELGPGDSIGVGLAALLSGVQRYVALDAFAHADPARNLRVFDQLVELFRRRAPIPGRDVFPEMALDLPDTAFPLDLIGEQALQTALAEDRIAWLREIIAGRPAPEVLDYRAPWGCVSGTDEASIDFLLSNAVMEHVTDLEGAYQAMSRWLRPGGIASNQIDFRSHGLFHAWDGHWACPDWLWRLFMGRRPYLLNREPLSTHRRLAAAAGFEEMQVLRVEAPVVSRRLASRYAGIDAEDRITCGGYLLLSRSMPGA